MKITIESTDKVVKFIDREAGSVMDCRIWEGTTDTGIAIHCYIPRIAVAEGLDSRVYAQFQAELKEQRKPSAEIQAIPLRLIL